MYDLILTYTGDDGAEEILVNKDRISFGRGSDADRRFDDSGLSRLHATVYREDDRVWVVDENSSNGTFVNGERVFGGGTPLRDGDVLKIGHHTSMKVGFRAASSPDAEEDEAPSGQTIASASGAPQDRSSLILPIAIIGLAVLVIGVSAVVIGVTVIGGGPEVSSTDSPFDPTPDDFIDDPTPGNETGNGDVNSGGGTADGGSNIPATPEFTPGPIGTPFTGGGGGSGSGLPSGKTYQQMSEEEKNQYVRGKAEVVSRVIGNSSGQSIPPEAVAKIRQFLDGYVRRIRGTRKNDCSTGGWVSSDMSSILQRAKENAPFIVRAFNEKGIDPQVGLYLAMIESEHCACLQSPTGPLGMFQFTQATGQRYGLETRSGASPSNPDQRCEKEPAARAAAAYMKALTGRIGTGPLSIPLAIASYNSGEGGLGKNLRTALEANASQDRSFWTLVANSEKLADQFQKENIKYVPKFFAAAIIGENPKDFGIDLLPLSLYTK